MLNNSTSCFTTNKISTHYCEWSARIIVKAGSSCLCGNRRQWYWKRRGLNGPTDLTNHVMGRGMRTEGEWVTGILEMNMTDKGWCTLPQSEWNKSIQQIDGDILCSTLSPFMTCYFSWSSQLAVPQFTFHRQCRNRNASGPSDITDFIRVHHQYQCLVKKLSNTYRPERVKSGVLEAMMALPFIEDAPIRIYYESTDSVVWFVLITLL